MTDVTGPSSPTFTTQVRSADDLAACRTLIRHGSHSFFLSSLLLPRRVAVPATALYAFCRVADDLIDGAEAGEEGGGAEAVAELRDRLEAVYAGQPGAAPEDRALAEVVTRFDIPRAMPAALLEGLAWDASGREYATLTELYDYAARVAGCVGAMMTLVMGTSDVRAVARACDLGVAMQLTNIARDVGEDARMGRLYLPRSWFADAGLDAADWLADPRDDVRIRAMTRRLLDYAAILYRRGETGLSLLPLACRPGIRAARLIYADIGREIAKAGYRTLDRRAVVPKARKVALLGKALATTPLGGPERWEDTLAWPPLSETRYLLEDIDSVPYKGRSQWLYELCETLERRDSGRA